MTKIWLIIIIILSTSAAFSKSICNPNLSALAGDLQRLVDVTQLNDCQIDLVVQLVGNERQYSLCARDLFLCSINKAYCQPRAFVFDLPKSCPVARSLQTARYQSSFKHPGGVLNSFIEFHVNARHSIMALRFGEMQFKPFQLRHYVDCTANPTGEPQ